MTGLNIRGEGEGSERKRTNVMEIPGERHRKSIAPLYFYSYFRHFCRRGGSGEDRKQQHQQLTHLGSRKSILVVFPKPGNLMETPLGLNDMRDTLLYSRRMLSMKQSRNKGPISSMFTQRSYLCVRV